MRPPRRGSDTSISAIQKIEVKFKTLKRSCVMQDREWIAPSGAVAETRQEWEALRNARLVEFIGQFFEYGGIKEWFGEDWDLDPKVMDDLTLRGQYLERLRRLAKAVRAGRAEYMSIASGCGLRPNPEVENGSRGTVSNAVLTLSAWSQ